MSAFGWTSGQQAEAEELMPLLIDALHFVVARAPVPHTPEIQRLEQMLSRMRNWCWCVYPHEAACPAHVERNPHGSGR